MKNPLISIIVPCYNQAQYLDECLESVLNQEYKSWECIIINDGSPDNCHEVADKWLQKDSRFKYIEKENGGVSQARNIGIDQATGEFILPLDADDRIGNTYTEKGIKAFLENTLLKVVYCNAEKFGEEIGTWNLSDFSLKKLSSDNIIFCSAIYRKSDWESIGGYDENMISGLEDWEFWIALLKNNGSALRINDTGFYYRIKSKSRQQDLKTSDKKKLFEYLSIKHADFFVSQKGSFMYLSDVINMNKTDFDNKLKSEKFVFKLFIKTVINFFKSKVGIK
ncbi:MAG: glycosyltransferase family A protein [Flavobacterium nitrogenifigens]|uniref:Glycosyl transferase family 2 n=1 Tax=Flavobacterium nitrogenifigens TaxID=1617283 RepID=A0A521EDU1_9FLAO|nr:glycosyltransferase family A protein [Flavobacterium nitrogenifigens]KAF2325942.1 glycosyltransferase family 2 protein [Flavobacterium nitrogenifigens]MDQ8013045.1 glycosyltransferase family A protein [Flavobacterium nitrogenifigens]SMO82097.1 Glycosyl transferase family 2 [Flavobacterium nitrogenifigens]